MELTVCLILYKGDVYSIFLSKLLIKELPSENLLLILSPCNLHEMQLHQFLLPKFHSEPNMGGN